MDDEKHILPAVKPPRIIVEHFDIASYKIDQAHGYVEADCQHCGATIKGQKNVTSNFIQHMRRRHSEAYDRFAASSQPRVKRPRLSNTPSKPVPAQTPTTPVLQPFTPPVRNPSSPVLARPELTLETALVSATYRAAVRTPCDPAARLSAITNCQLYIKREDLQVGSSPIFRAAYNYLAATPTSRAGVVASGPTALPLAAAAHKHSKPCFIYIPLTAPTALRRALDTFGAKFEATGDTLAETVATAQNRAKETNRTYVDLSGSLRPGFTDAVAGYATLALEILQQRPHADRVFLAGGNSPLFAGLSAVLQRLGRGVKLVGVTLRGESREEWSAYAAAVVEISHDEMCAGVKLLFEDCDNCLLEPYGAVSVAGAIRFARENKLNHERLVCIVSDSLRGFDALEMVTRRASKADGSRCLLCVRKAGEAATLAPLMRELRGTAGGRARLTGVRFGGTWPVLLGLACDDTTTAAAHVANLLSLGYRASDVTGSLHECDAELWQRDEGEWALFRVELTKNTASVVEFLAAERELPFRRVSFEDDGSATAKLVVGTKGADWHIEALETELMGKALSVERISPSIGGLSIMGCGVPVLEEGIPDLAPAEGAEGQGLVAAEGTELPVAYVETDGVEVGVAMVGTNEDPNGQVGQEVVERQEVTEGHEAQTMQEGQETAVVESGHTNLEGQEHEEQQTQEIQEDGNGIHDNGNANLQHNETQVGVVTHGNETTSGVEVRENQTIQATHGDGIQHKVEVQEGNTTQGVRVADNVADAGGTEGVETNVVMAEDGGDRGVHAANGIVANEGEGTIGNVGLDTEGVVIAEVDGSVVGGQVVMESVDEGDGGADGSLEAGAAARLDADLERVAQADAMVGSGEGEEAAVAAVAAVEAIHVPART